MSDARQGYENTIDNLYANFRDTVTDAYQTMADNCDRAWYTYQVRTGMVTVPGSNSEQDGPRGNPVQGSGPSESSIAESGQPAPGADGAADIREGTEEAEAAGNSDEGTSPDPG